MFGLDFNNLGSVFEKLPPALQIALALGVFVGGVFLVIRQLTGKSKNGEQVHPLAIELAKTAAELADAKLRQDLMQVMESTRVGLENRIERLFGEVRGTIAANEAQAKQDRHGIYNRMQEQSQGFDHSLEQIEQRIRRLENRED